MGVLVVRKGSPVSKSWGFKVSKFNCGYRWSHCGRDVRKTGKQAFFLERGSKLSARLLSPGAVSFPCPRLLMSQTAPEHSFFRRRRHGSAETSVQLSPRVPGRPRAMPDPTDHAGTLCWPAQTVPFPELSS